MEPVPGGDLEQLRKELAPDCLGEGRQLVEERLEISWTQDARTIFQGIICGIAVLACLYVAQDIVLRLWRSRCRSSVIYRPTC